MARLAGTEIRRDIDRQKLPMAKDQNALKIDAFMEIVSVIQKKAPACFGCEKIQVDSQQRMTSDALSMRVSCGKSIGATSMTCPDGTTLKLIGSTWVESDETRLGDVLKGGYGGMAADFIVYDEVGNMPDASFFVKPKEPPSKDIPQTACEEGW